MNSLLQLPSRLLYISLVIVALVCAAAAQLHAADSSPVKDVRIENLDAAVAISWQIATGSTADVLEGIKIYQLREGTEMGFQVDPAVLRSDVKHETDCMITGLSNGEQIVFLLKAYDKGGKVFWQKVLLGFPGTSPAGPPAAPADVYGAAGDGRVTLFWRKNVECDLFGYEVFRRCAGDEDFRMVNRIGKVDRVVEELPGIETGTHQVQIVREGMSVDESVRNGEVCVYRVRAVDSEGLASVFSRSVDLQPQPARPTAPAEVLLLVNGRVTESVEVARHYAKQRGIPDENIVSFAFGKNSSRLDYAQEIQKPLQEHLLKHGIAGKVKYLVPCYGFPILAAGRAVDSKLADLFDRFTWGRTMGTMNPFFGSTYPFDGTYGIYLVTRIDGPSPEIAKSLVDKALAAGNELNALSGPAYFSANADWEGAYLPITAVRDAAKGMGIPVHYTRGQFTVNQVGNNALWYFTMRYPWEHNPKEGTWRTGAVGAHLISDSFYKIRRGDYDPKYKSWVEGLLEGGITATFGAVIEPYLEGYTQPDRFFTAFWSGDYNFAEAFWTATPTVQWAMSAVGDPLYRLKKPAMAKDSNGNR